MGTTQTADGVVDAVGPTLGDGSGTRPGWRARLDGVVLAASLLVLLLPLASAVSALRHPWIGHTDWVLIEEAVRDVGGSDTPLIGAFSRFGWHHPGPWPFYVMAPFYRLVPAENGLLFAAGSTNLLVALAYVLVVVRYPRTRALVALIAFAVLERGLGAEFLSDPWNPNVAILPFALYLVLCVELAQGRRGWVAPAAVAAGSFAVQAHLGLVAPVVLVGAATLLVARRSRSGVSDGSDGSGGPDGSDGSTRGGARWQGLKGWWATAVVVTVAWLPPVLDQLGGSGNLWKIARWSFGGEIVEPGPWDQGRLPAGDVVTGAAWLLDPGGMWAGRFSVQSAGFLWLIGQGSSWRLLLLVGLLGATYWLVTRVPNRGHDARAARVAWGLSLVGVVATIAALAGTRGVPFLWGLRWVAVVVMLAWIAFGWAVAAVLVPRHPWLDTSGGGPRAPRLAVAAGAVALVALPVGLAVLNGSLGEQPSQAHSELWLRFEPRVLRILEDEELVVIEPPPFAYSIDLTSLPLILERAGIRWVRAADPDAAGRPTYYVVRSTPTDRDPGHIVARSGPPDPKVPDTGELLLIRVAPVESEPASG